MGVIPASEMYGLNSNSADFRFRHAWIFFGLMSFIKPIVTVGQIAPGSAPVCKASRRVPPIPANAEQVASILGILPIVQRVRVIASGCGPDGGISLEEITLRQQITEKVLSASLDVHVVLAEIDSELTQISDLQEKLLSGRDNKVSTLTLYSIMIGTGSNVAGAGLQF